MIITAKVEDSFHENRVRVQTNDTAQELPIPGRSTGMGLSVNGGEMLCLALATCFCNDIYREAKKKNIHVTKVVVEASAEFAGPGEPGFNLHYKATLEGDASPEELRELIQHTDQVSEIQNTLRTGVGVTLVPENLKVATNPTHG